MEQTQIMIKEVFFILTNDDVNLQNNSFIYSNNITQLVDFNMYCSIQSRGVYKTLRIK